MPVSDREWSASLRRVGVVYLITRFFVVMGAAIAVSAWAVWARYSKEEPVGGLKGLLDVLVSWDGHWYLDVVREGYPHHIIPNVTYFVPDARAAFFPLYPRLVHFVDLVLPGGPVWVSILVNFVLGALFVYLFGVIARQLFDVKTAERAMILACIFPGSFVLLWAYSEALLLVLASLCFLALWKERWLVAGLLAALATATRPNGLALVAACAVASFVAIRSRRDWGSLVAPLLSPAGFVAFMLFLRQHTDENWAWFRVQREAWKEGTSFGATALSRTLKFFVDPASTPTTVLTAASVVAMVIALLLLRRHRVPFMYTAYSLSVLFLMLLPATVTARPRFLYTAFPLLLPVARQLRDDDDKWWPLTVAVMLTGLVTVTGIYGVRGAIP